MSAGMYPAVAAVIRRVRDTVQGYGDQHASKDLPQPHKAQVNYQMVADLNELLSVLATQEAVRLSDNLAPHPARERLKVFLETLGDRDDDAFVSYNALLGDLRALTKDS
jgi:hypothetical protein